MVDAENRFLRWEDRHTIHVERLIHRSIHVLVFDSAGKLVIQRRHRDKQTHPSYWDMSCAGHVEESDYLGGPDEALDQVYAEVAAREVEEELGVTPALSELGHFPPEAGIHYEQIRLFRATHDGPFTIQAEEVEELQRVSPSELAALGEQEPVTEALRFFAAWASERGLWA